ncbi:MAG: family ATPase [Bacteroidota bacterium]|nr:family ATPase [Bacteroidota bacterium]
MEKKKVVEQQNKEHSYFYSLELEGINCFKVKQTLDLSDGNGNHSPWIIILGDNGTGKTTLLRVLDRMQPSVIKTDYYTPVIWSYNSILMSKKSGVKLKVNDDIKEFYVEENENRENNSSFITKGNQIFPFLLSYGASRRMSRNENLSPKNQGNLKITSLFDESIELINAEEWFLQKEWASFKSTGITKQKFENDFNLVKYILIDILPDVIDIQSKPIDENNSKPILEVKTSYGWVNLRNLSFGYQTLTALIVDIASKMMEQYPNGDNPLQEPAVILIDEIDLHLHPKWQRTVIDKLSQHFPKAQFIATSHSPLIVQAALDKKANIVVCRKEGDKVVIDNNPDEVKGWRIDQILTSDLFEVESPRSKNTQENLDEYMILKGKSELTQKDKEKIEELTPNIEKAYPKTTSDLDEKLSKFAEKYLK